MSEWREDGRETAARVPGREDARVRVVPGGAAVGAAGRRGLGIVPGGLEAGGWPGRWKKNGRRERRVGRGCGCGCFWAG